MPTQGEPTDHHTLDRRQLGERHLGERHLGEQRDRRRPARRRPRLAPGAAVVPGQGLGHRAVRPRGGRTLTDPRGEAEVRILLVRARSSTVDSVLQVPLTLHPAGRPTTTSAPAAPAPTGRLDRHGAPARRPAGARRRRRPGVPAGVAGGGRPGATRAPADLGLDTENPRVISGEQSNTSVILSGPDGGAILKVFRGLTPGENPDVDVPRRLAATGWTHVPRPLGWLDGTWTTDDGDASGSLGVLSEFVAGATGRVRARVRHGVARRVVRSAGRGPRPRRRRHARRARHGRPGRRTTAAAAPSWRRRSRSASGGPSGSVPELEEWSAAVTERLARVARPLGRAAPPAGARRPAPGPGAAAP